MSQLDHQFKELIVVAIRAQLIYCISLGRYYQQRVKKTVIITFPVNVTVSVQLRQ